MSSTLSQKLHSFQDTETNVFYTVCTAVRGGGVNECDKKLSNTSAFLQLVSLSARVFLFCMFCLVINYHCLLWKKSTAPLEFGVGGGVNRVSHQKRILFTFSSTNLMPCPCIYINIHCGIGLTPVCTLTYSIHSSMGWRSLLPSPSKKDTSNPCAYMTLKSLLISTYPHCGLVTTFHFNNITNHSSW
jgi:hypothetical protein